MKRIVKALGVLGALGVLVSAGPAGACEAHQKTTVTKNEKGQPEKARAQKAQDDARTAKAQAKGGESGAQAKAQPRPDAR